MALSKLSKQHAESVTTKSVLADGSLCFRTRKFTQIVTRLAPGALLVSGIGYNSGECAPLITAELTRVIATGAKLSPFVNLAEQTGQASAAREWWAEWVQQNRAQLGTAHILVRSRIMDMAISVLAMVVGGGMIKAHSNVAEFEAVIAAQVPGFRRLPLFPDLPPLLDQERST
jgi:hypothetical protein